MRQITLFAVAGIAGFIVDALAFILFSELLNVHLSRIASFAVAVNATYYLNKNYTFATQTGKYWSYVIGQSSGIVVNFLVFELVFFFIPASWAYSALLAFVAGSVSAMFFNYFYAKTYVFR